MPSPVVLFRRELDPGEEFSIASSVLKTVEYRTDVPPGSLVVGRYSVLPYYGELERELSRSGSRLVNNLQSHEFVADITSWACDGHVLSGLTPRTWSDWRSLPADCSFVLKGKTNSRKDRWRTHMFAQTREDVPKVAARLLDDTMIREQGIVVREYVPMVRLGVGLNELPVTNEFRTFWIRPNDRSEPKLLGRGFYWRGSHPELEDLSQWTPEAETTAREAANLVSEHVSFFALDVAERAAGGWTVVEVNDGQMSGLCGCSPTEVYGNLALLLADVTT